jgi:hypothetical protein
MGVNKHVRPLKEKLTEENFEALIQSVIQYFVSKIEALILRKKFTFVRVAQIDRVHSLIFFLFSFFCTHC